MVFLLGDHTLDMNITVANKTWLTMCGESSSGNIATIVCSESVGFNFTGILDFKIHSIAFTTCGRNSLAQTGARKYAVLLESIDFAELVNCSFHDNLGSALAVYNTDISLIESTEFLRNHYESSTPDSSSHVGGGGITALSSNLTFIGNTTFLENTANYHSGGIYMMRCNLSSTGNIHFINNSNILSTNKNDAGAIWASSSSLHFTRINTFAGNLAQDAGAIYAGYNTVLKFTGASNFNHNHGGIGAVSTSDNVILTCNGTTNFVSNGGGAIRASANTSVLLHGTVTFVDNKAAIWGGGVYLGSSTFSVFPNTTVYWERNHARLGGAIYVDDEVNTRIYCRQINACEASHDCFFQLPGQNLSNGIQAQFIFKDNSVDTAGSVLYGGAIDHCKLTGLGSHKSGEVFDMLVHVEDENTTSSIISSAPFRICPCENNYPFCNLSAVINTVYPGETFLVSVVAAGQRHGTISAFLSTRAYNGDLLSDQYIQFTNNTCTPLNYTVFSQYNRAELELYADGPCSTFGDKLSLFLDINETCPAGFSLSEKERSCVCEPRLEKYTNRCDITYGLGRIARDSNQQFWVGYDNSLRGSGLILHPHCPLDYCVFNRVDFALNDTDLQCSNNRSGLLCGACKTGYSLVLGNSQCKQCTNTYLALLIPFALMGVALVLLLFICKLTVATGTLSGLVFYANIVGVNRTIFLPVKNTNAFSVFIAWLNLDFGVNTCFYDGMDAYNKTWLQFVFPVYVWLIVALMILVSKYSSKFAGLLGSNPVSVLATLILLSYTKVLRTVIAAVSITYLEYPTYNRGVWLYDANLDYLNGKHIPLFLVAMLVFFLFLPYTLLLLCGQWLQAMSNLRIFAWINRLKPFIDSYHAPYKPKHRYWPGLLLVFRFGLLQVFAFNSLQDPSISLLAIQVGTALLQLWAWISHGVYRNWCLDALEGSFALNLIILAAATMHINTSGGDQLAIGYTSVTIALVTFIGILVYHILQQTNLWKKVPIMNVHFNFKQAVSNPEEVEDSNQLREPLLEDAPQTNYGGF